MRHRRRGDLTAGHNAMPAAVEARLGEAEVREVAAGCPGADRCDRACHTGGVDRRRVPATSPASSTSGEPRLAATPHDGPLHSGDGDQLLQVADLSDPIEGCEGLMR